MLRNLYLLGLVLLFSSSAAFGQTGSGTLKGKLTDSETGEPLPFVNIVLQSGTRQVAGGATDFDGEYTIKPIEPGSYNVLISYVGYNAKQIQGVKINSSKITFLDIELESGIKLDEFEVVEYTVPLIDKDGGSTGGTVTRENIARMPGRSASSIAATVGGIQETSNGEISMRGARTDNTFFYIDGIKVRGSNNLPKAAIEEVNVITGGIPANYGDATGGIIAITTRGASSQYFGSIDVLTSGFANEDGDGIGLDRYSQTQIEAVLSGPLLWKKDAEGNRDRPLLGFFASGNYRNFLDGRPTFGNYRLKEESRNRLINDPLSFRLNNLDVNNTQGRYINKDGDPVDALSVSPSIQGIANSELIREDDWEKVPARQNDRVQGVSATFKLDIATAPNFDLSFGGTFDWEKDNLYNYSNSLFNAVNNGEQTDQTWRAFGRFTQRFNSDSFEDEDEGLIKNAFYSIMVDYSRRKRVRQDPRHQDNLFNYGYVGSFNTETAANYIFRDINDTIVPGYYQEGDREIATNFTASDVNSDLASYTSALYRYYDEIGYQITSLDDIQSAGAYINGQIVPDVYNLYSPVGDQYNSYALFNQNQFRITGSGSADIGDHAITLGFEFEQYTERNFGSSPVALWTQARARANSHLQEFDKTIVSNEFSIGQDNYFSFDRIVELDEQSTFDRNLRTSLGLDPNGSDIINVDGLDPSVFNLEMFSADELLREGNNSLVSYYGYDYKGDIITGSRPTIEDFFNERNENGDFTRPIAAFEPVYIAGYIMDKFAFDDIIFNVGVRIDRFDANQSVLKDKWVIGDARTASEIRNPANEDQYFGELPSNVQDDWVVYVNDINDPTAINGFRDEDTWYDASGIEIPDPRAISTASGIAPLLRDPSAVGQKLNSDAFEDYQPQINVMPRVSFSFPISDEAVFFAHYDILTQRPTGQNIANPADYLLIRNLGNLAIDNPNLKPTTTIDYELGFQQVISKSSSLKISAFYRETRDEIQARRLLEAYPVTYTTFDNFDFGTTQGLTLSYDLRRTGNISVRASYTLQFAAATGSSAGSALNLVNSGEPNLRVIFPTDRDQRHVFVGTFDYRYGSGKDYNGPNIGGKQIFSNAGLNIVGNLGSGTPYSQQQAATGEAFVRTLGSPQLEGTVNGSRLPWQFRINAQIDKSFEVNLGKEGEEQKQAFLNIYLLVNNILNTQNIINVYRFTGNPDDDGYLSAPQFRPNIENQIDPQSFRQLYALKAATPFNYSSPRTIQLGVRFDF